MPDCYFTLEEAQQMVPWLEEAFRALAPLHEKVQHLGEEVATLEKRTQSNGGSKTSAELDLLRPGLNEAADALSSHLDEVQSRGVIVKSIDEGLVDFPSMREGRVVYLCWHTGEERIGFWHELNTGFAARQPL